MKLLRLAVCLILLLIPAEGKGAPYGGSSTVYNDPVVCKQFEKMWQADENGTMREGTWEYGFCIDYVEGHLQVGPLIMGDEALRVHIPCDKNTIAIAHVHPNNGVATPSQIDMDGKYPDYVVSRDGLCVTNPKTHTYQKIKTFDEQFKPMPKHKS